VYDDRERAVLKYAKAASATPAFVSEELTGRLHGHFTEAQIVELAAWVALENRSGSTPAWVSAVRDSPTTAKCLPLP
jgi:alkylhydroperoxidase family enzyme